jgi:hypothetical protein
VQPAAGASLAHDEVGEFFPSLHYGSTLNLFGTSSAQRVVCSLTHAQRQRWSRPVDA